MHTVSIIGCGLMGGSFGLALKSARPELSIMGWDTAGSLEMAVQRGAIDRAAQSLEDCVEGTDLVVLATPLSATMHIIDDLQGVLAILDAALEVVAEADRHHGSTSSPEMSPRRRRTGS